MLQKCFMFIRGFMRASTLLIVFIVLVTFYFYQDKIKEVAGPYIERSKQNGILFYATGIWDNMKGVQQNSDQRNQRAMELVEGTKTIGDKANLYSLAVPQSWNVSVQQGAVGNQMSKMVVKSSAFSERSIASDIFYDDGAQLTVRAIKGEQASAKLADGGYGKAMISKKSVAVDNESATAYVITDPAVKSGEIMEAPVIHAGNTYVFRFVYNKQKYSDGEFTFSEMLASFKFNNTK